MVEGKDVDVVWLDGNDGEVMKALVYLRGGERIMCEAIQKPRYHRARIEQTEADKENMSIVMSYIKTIEGFISRRKAEIEPVLVIDHRTSVVNNKFVIPGLDQPQRYMAEEDDEVVIMDDEPKEAAQVTAEAEILEDVSNDVRTTLEQHSNRVRLTAKEALLKQFIS